MTATIILVIAIVVAVIAAVAGYYLIRHSRGNIKLTLGGDRYDPGDTIEGSFTLLTKKPLAGKQLLVTVIGKEITEERDGNTTHTRTREIYRDEQIIEGPKSYPAGETRDYSFQIAAPDINRSSSIGGVLGEIVDVGLDLLSPGRRLEWRVEARLDADGVDLSDSARIYLSGGSLL